MIETLVHLNIATYESLSQEVVDKIVKAAQQVIDQMCVEGEVCCPLYEEV
jgi:hypothetical protein